MTDNHALTEDSLWKAINTLRGPLQVISGSGKPTRIFDEDMNEVFPDDPRWRHWKSIINGAK